MSVQVTPEQLSALRATLLNTAGNTPLHERFRSLFMLKAVGGDEVVDIVAEGLKDPSPLLKHELAYVLGQLLNKRAIPILSEVLVNPNGAHCSMVRHEAAEALGAIGDLESLPVLRKYLDDPSREVRETCEIAVGKIEFDNSEEGKQRKQNPDFPTIDPAPSASSGASSSIPSLRTDLLNTKLPLFERYRAMFALRDFGAGSKEAVEALADGFGDASALFRHEVAYIFGQLSSPYSIPSLLSRLRDAQEDDMVRHEAAEALGGIASDGVEGEDQAALPVDQQLPSGGVLAVLREWAVKQDAPIVVRESCQVAIDMWEYENSTDQFNPLDSLTSSHAEKTNTTGMERSAHAAVAAMASA
ncbi:deoxyhypusine hydroxylase [Kwoniella heveanensis CBS 569]|uniref:Deoxyhypusine hydroxylase n=1 Tax=Kwoniella heveanensis BCC8398 TaxID=1296120 RepID=A0A1B9GIC3_9TREE|nr:deoxyhypusine hydroxylase [Kwoniella heveanensis BCC8398]OCF38634.1 deoxyhypusine hydroxylase [Kwoniella heveanensis CBS 569]